MENIQLPLIMEHLAQEGYFCGYASVFDISDSHKDRIQSGAFQKSISALERANRMPKMLWQHDHHTPIGLWTFMEEDARGLYVEGKLLLDIQKAREAYALLKAKAIDGLSIGFVVEKASKNAQGGRDIQSLHLHEISVVTFASNPEAQVMSVKKIESST